MIVQEDAATVLMAGRLRLIAYYRLVTREMAWSEELFREVCSMARQRTEGFDSAEHLLKWARLAGRNLGVEMVRQRRGEYVGLAPEVLARVEVEWLDCPDATTAEGLEALSRCMADESEEMREILKWYFLEGTPLREVGERFGVEPAALELLLAQVQLRLLACVRSRLADA
jgi:DNA-directed RNA polymerase specialized sigma24 family protein